MNTSDAPRAGQPATTTGADIRNVSKRLGDFRLHDISLPIPAGYITGFVGPNGAGKTSTIKCLLGMLHPDEGEVTVLGRPAGTPSDSIGIVLDTPAYVGDWRVRDVARAVARFYASWEASRFELSCERFSLPRDRKVKELSRGMAMKLQLAVALSHETRLLVLDEPTSGLDAGTRDDLLGILQEYMLDERNAVLFSTHITADLERVADYVAVIDDGRILHHDATTDLIARYALVHGGPADLTDRGRAAVRGLRTHPSGFEGLVDVDDLALFGPGVDASTPTLDEIVLALSRKASSS